MRNARNRVREPLPARKPGQIAKYDNEYKRCGTANIFGVVEPKVGRHFTTVTPNRSGAAFAKVVKQVADAYPQAETIHLVLRNARGTRVSRTVDNLNTHSRKMLIDSYGEEEGAALWDRFTIHYTPLHGSWLNQAEIELSVVNTECLGKRRLGSVLQLGQEVRAWKSRVNHEKLKINWRFDRKAARRKFQYKAPGKQRKAA